MSAARRPRVLVIDDEAFLLRAYERLLRPIADLVLVEDSEAARDLLRSDTAFDMILCDVQMPRLTGPELYGYLQDSQPTLAARFVFVTGIDDDTEVQATGRPWLLKPVHPRALIEAITKLLP